MSGFYTALLLFLEQAMFNAYKGDIVRKSNQLLLSQKVVSIGNIMLSLLNQSLIKLILSQVLLIPSHFLLYCCSCWGVYPWMKCWPTFTDKHLVALYSYQNCCTAISTSAEISVNMIASMNVVIGGKYSSILEYGSESKFLYFFFFPQLGFIHKQDQTVNTAVARKTKSISQTKLKDTI